MKKRLTIQEFAKKINVSVATVSRAMNDETRSKVAPKTLKLVQEGVAKYGYTPNLSAKHLRNPTYKTLGIVFVHHEGLLLSKYYSHLLSGFSDGCLKEGYRAKLLMLEPEKGPWDHYDFKNGEGIDGLVITYWKSIFSNAKVFNNLDIPSVVVNNVEKGIAAKYIAADHVEGGRLIAEHLYRKGHRKVGIVGGLKGGKDSQEKLKAFYDYYKSKGVEKSSMPFFEVDFKESETEKKAKTILNTAQITALFCMDDCQAIPLLKNMHLRKKGYVSVIGHGNEMRGLITKPQLTTVDAPVQELGYQAAVDIAKYLKDKNKKAFLKEKRFGVKLVERASVVEV